MKTFEQIRKYGPALAGVGALSASLPASAAIDVAAVVTEISGTAAPIAAIGAAVLIVMVGIKAYKWVRRAM